jgi:hypothetical protein
MHLFQGCQSATGVTSNGALFCQGQRPVISSSKEKLRNVRMITMMPRTPTLANVGSMATVRMMSPATNQAGGGNDRGPSHSNNHHCDARRIDGLANKLNRLLELHWPMFSVVSAWFAVEGKEPAIPVDRLSGDYL